jgi:hypothetical protein
MKVGHIRWEQKPDGSIGIIKSKEGYYKCFYCKNYSDEVCKCKGLKL